MKILINGIVILVLAGLVVSGCGSDTGDQSDTETPIGGSYSQCLGHSPGTGEELPEVIITIDRLVPSEAEIRCSGKKVFLYEDREVSLVYVAYGALYDCPSGCVSSFVCGIYDPDQPLLYSFAWSGPVERPLSIPPDCPELADFESGHTSLCSTPPRGVDHPVTTTVEFESFRSSQREDGGNWRFCFW